MKGYKRRRYIIDGFYQGKFAVTVVAICATGMFISLAIFNYLSYRAFESVVWMAHINITTVGELLRHYLLISNAVGIVLTIILLFAFSRFVLHKTAPPLFKLKRYIETVGAGNLTATIDWTERDEFKETAEEFNKMVVALRDKFMAVKEKAEVVIADSEHLGYVMDKPDMSLEKCKALIENLDTLKESLQRTG